jgi:general secretion pathway protein C
MLFANEATLWFKQNIPINWLWKGLCCLFIFAIFWNMVSLFFNDSSTQMSVIQTSEQIKPQKINMQQSLHAPLFGVYVPNPKDANVAVSKLSYVVVGIMYAEDARESQVVLRNETGFDVIYRQNDFIKPGLQLKAIQPDGVIILNRGQLERLSLPKNDLRFDQPPAPLMMKE